MSETIKVLWWKYLDGSGMGIARAYLEPERAAEDLALLQDSATAKQWQLSEVELLGDYEA